VDSVETTPSKSTTPTSLAQRTAVIVLTLNAERYLDKLFSAIEVLSIPPGKVLFVDSSSSDQTVSLAIKAGHQVHVIARSEFGHGKTRNLAATLCSEYEFLLFLTHDACPQGGDWLSKLLSPFSDANVGLVYGRQLPRPGSVGSERFAREFNYPAEVDRTVRDDLARRGIKAVFCSNSFAAYRGSVLNEVGGFPENLPMGEDMAVTLRILQRGYARYYQAEACAVHSHAYTLVEEFKRYFDIGTLMSLDTELRQVQLAASGEGLRFLRGELRAAWYLKDVLQVAQVLMRTLAKYVGFVCGQHYAVLPKLWRRRFSMHSYFWSNR
jgi:rhamnosyltransferase